MKKEEILTTVGWGTFWNSFGNILVKITGLVTIFFILRTLSLYEYGLSELVLSVISAFSIFLLIGLQSVVAADMGVEAGRRDTAKLKSIFLNYWKLQLVLAGFAWLLVFFGAGLIELFYNAHIAYLIRIVSFIFILSILKVPLYTLFPVNFKFFYQSLYNFLEELCKLGLILFFFFVLHKGVEGLLYAIILSQFLAAALMAPKFFEVYRPLKDVAAERLPLLHLLRAHGKWSIFSGYMGTLGQNARLWVTKFFLGTEMVGLLAVSQGVIAQLSSFAPLHTIVNPVLARFTGNLVNLGRVATAAIKYQLLLFGAIALSTVLLLPTLFFLFFPNYVPALPLIFLMFPVFIPIAVGGVFTQIFSVLKAQKSLFFSVFLKTAVSAGLLFAFLPLFGFWGLAYEYVLTNILSMIERYMAVRRKIPSFELFAIGKYDEVDKLVLSTVTAAFRKLL